MEEPEGWRNTKEPEDSKARNEEDDADDSGEGTEEHEERDEDNDENTEEHEGSDEDNGEESEQPDASEQPEVWKPITGFPKYQISNKGNVQGPRKMLKLKPDAKGYVRVQLKRGVRKRVQRLVLEHFAPTTDPTKTIANHRNGIRHDNNLSNVEWETLQGNAQKIVNKRPNRGRRRQVQQAQADGTIVKIWSSVKEAAEHMKTERRKFGEFVKHNEEHKGFLWGFYADIIEGEEWVDVVYKGTKYKASTMGRLETKSGVRTFGTPNGSYMVQGKHFVHDVIATAFPTRCPKPRGATQVNHKDLNKLNNAVTNLEWVSASRNCQHSHDEGAHERDRKVDQYSLDGKLIGGFISISRASRETGDTIMQIWSVCNHKKQSTDQFVWRYKGE